VYLGLSEDDVEPRCIYNLDYDLIHHIAAATRPSEASTDANLLASPLGHLSNTDA